MIKTFITKHVLRKEEGAISAIALVMMFLFIFIIFTLYTVKIQTIKTAKTDIMNSIDVANHAALLIDKNMSDDSAVNLMLSGFASYSNQTMYVVPDTSFNNYRKAFISSIGDRAYADYSTKNSSVKNLKLESVILYDVVSRISGSYVCRDIQLYKFDANGHMVDQQYYADGANNGNVVTPTGHIVKETCIYSNVSFAVKIFKGQEQTAHLDLTSELRRDSSGEHNNMN